MLQTKKSFTENIIRFYDDNEIISFLLSKEGLKGIYQTLTNADNSAAVYPLIIPISNTEIEFDLMLIIKHEKETEAGLWDLFVVENFLKTKTNLAELFEFIELTTKADIQIIIQSIQKELKRYREHYKLNGKTFVEIDGVKKIIRFGFLKQ